MVILIDIQMMTRQFGPKRKPEWEENVQKLNSAFKRILSEKWAINAPCRGSHQGTSRPGNGLGSMKSVAHEPHPRAMVSAQHPLILTSLNGIQKGLIQNLNPSGTGNTLQIPEFGRSSATLPSDRIDMTNRPVEDGLVNRYIPPLYTYKHAYTIANNAIGQECGILPGRYQRSDEVVDQHRQLASAYACPVRTRTWLVLSQVLSLAMPAKSQGMLSFKDPWIEDVMTTITAKEEDTAKPKFTPS
ncbi:unnamed protein product [Protopolystoma xenopodis]|uniref:Uncharacterized protein n=1 Tax=Protopolystoma xenopodis TaxID=117903 RepID=A0A448WWW2_9PLAT|nr:unnamed protein product [Protopolystoma xenopodis]